jgi:hypothetical protein
MIARADAFVSERGFVIATVPPNCECAYLALGDTRALAFTCVLALSESLVDVGPRLAAYFLEG